MLPAAGTSMLLVLFAVFSPKVAAAGENPCNPAAGELYCTPGINQCYKPGTYNCLATATGTGNWLCPVNTCLCGAITCYTSQYSCDKDGNIFLITKDNPPQNYGNCGGGSGGDPLVRGFDGCRWYLDGVAGKVYNLVQSREDTVNTLLVAANLTDRDHAGNGTYHGTVSFRHLQNLVTTTVSAEGNLTVTVDGKEQPMDSRFTAGEIKGKVVRHMTFFGQYAEIRTPSFTYAVQAVQPLTTDSGSQRGHVDLDITVHKTVSGLHGLLGQSYKNIQSPSCREDYAFSGVGTEQDYILPALASIPEAHERDTRVSRRLIEDEAVTFPLTASV